MEISEDPWEISKLPLRRQKYLWLHEFSDWLPVWHALKLMERSGASFSDETLVGIRKNREAAEKLLAHVLARHEELGVSQKPEVAIEWENMREGR
jgi:hypothetical protein